MFSGIRSILNGLTSDPGGTIITLLYVAVCILFSLILHECAHGWVAYKCGDPTAKMLGRLTLNPAKHLDPFGTICMVFLHVGWARPVPVNPRNFRHFRRDYIMVSLAGIITNLLLCFLSLIISALLCRVIYNSYVLDYVRQTGLQNNMIDVYHMYMPNAIYNGEFQVVAGNLNSGAEWALFVQRFFLMLATMNLGLAVFNLLPVPPLDGYRFLDMFVFRGKLMIDQRIAQLISLGFMVLLLSGVFDSLLSLVNGTVFGFFSNIAGALV